ncbi:hypothetical protein R1flu_010111 [Riccia fluitans]|uniref:Uncharacterized protein n=1 Tax=Riccia fluitans TaxID=41844 RepID=A0ABD1Z429_9MARC
MISHGVNLAAALLLHDSPRSGVNRIVGSLDGFDGVASPGILSWFSLLFWFPHSIDVAALIAKQPVLVRFCDAPPPPLVPLLSVHEFSKGRLMPVLPSTVHVGVVCVRTSDPLTPAIPTQPMPVACHVLLFEASRFGRFANSSINLSCVYLPIPHNQPSRLFWPLAALDGKAPGRWKWSFVLR